MNKRVIISGSMYHLVFMHIDGCNLFIDDHLFSTKLVFALDCNRLFLQPTLYGLPGWTSIKHVMLWLLIFEKNMCILSRLKGNQVDIPRSIITHVKILCSDCIMLKFITNIILYTYGYSFGMIE